METKEILNTVLNNVTVINRFRHKIEDKIPEYDDRTKTYFESMCRAIDNLTEMADKLIAQQNNNKSEEY